MTTRRQFIQTSAGAIGIGTVSPSFWAHAATRLASTEVLVVVQMSGGNDGLNTVVPYADENYYKHRQKLGWILG